MDAPAPLVNAPSTTGTGLPSRLRKSRASRTAERDPRAPVGGAKMRIPVRRHVRGVTPDERCQGPILSKHHDLVARGGGRASRSGEDHAPSVRQESRLSIHVSWIAHGPRVLGSTGRFRQVLWWGARRHEKPKAPARGNYDLPIGRPRQSVQVQWVVQPRRSHGLGKAAGQTHPFDGSLLGCMKREPFSVGR